MDDKHEGQTSSMGSTSSNMGTSNVDLGGPNRNERGQALWAPPQTRVHHADTRAYQTMHPQLVQLVPRTAQQPAHLDHRQWLHQQHQQQQHLAPCMPGVDSMAFVGGMVAQLKSEFIDLLMARGMDIDEAVAAFEPLIDQNIEPVMKDWLATASGRKMDTTVAVSCLSCCEAAAQKREAGQFGSDNNAPVANHCTPWARDLMASVKYMEVNDAISSALVGLKRMVEKLRGPQVGVEYFRREIDKLISIVTLDFAIEYNSMYSANMRLVMRKCEMPPPTSMQPQVFRAQSVYAVGANGIMQHQVHMYPPWQVERQFAHQTCCNADAFQEHQHQQQQERELTDRVQGEGRQSPGRQEQQQEEQQQQKEQQQQEEQHQPARVQDDGCRQHEQQHQPARVQDDGCRPPRQHEQKHHDASRAEPSLNKWSSRWKGPLLKDMYLRAMFCKICGLAGVSRSDECPYKKETHERIIQGKMEKFKYGKSIVLALENPKVSLRLIKLIDMRQQQ